MQADCISVLHGLTRFGSHVIVKIIVLGFFSRSTVIKRERVLSLLGLIEQKQDLLLEDKYEIEVRRMRCDM